MIDIHCHLLPGVDDGSDSFSESKKIILNAKKNGVTDIIVTPHYIKGKKISINNEKKVDIFKELLEYSKNLDINLYLGNEIFYNDNLIGLENEFLSLAGSKYILLEFSRSVFPENIFRVIHELNILGYKVIIAHPERYSYFQQDINLLIPFLKKGVLFQSNISSFFNGYGYKSKKAIKLMIKHNMIHFLASDSHKANDGRYDCFSNLNKFISEEKIKELTITNPKHILENKDINVGSYKPCKYFLKNFLKKYKVNLFF